MTKINKDCFDNCANTQCWRNGHDCLPFEECGFIPIDYELAEKGCKMNLEEYEKESSRTMAPTMYDGAFITETLHGIIGISTEAGELLDAVKKGLFYGHAPDMDNIREEIGDIMWYIMAVVRAEGWSLEEIMQENIDKLRIRYPEQFTKELSKDRLDKK
ncbi:MAG: hypothetical protein DRO67_01990 [Candidatus Asgardarchaeum californiense]|nr:MAG: hypothetical protein DRO67_01990 [Candidatus Asgardarchaeum californiense]